MNNPENISCNFSYFHFSDAVQKFGDAGYVFGSTTTNSEKSIQIVHDVDFALEPALEMARLENRIGLKTIYFFRSRSKNYNLLSPSTISSVRTIESLGHEVGLHYETYSGITDEEQYEADFIRHREFLRSETGLELRSHNVHEPSRTGSQHQTVEEGMNYFFRNKRWQTYKYISDSGGRWREDCFCRFVDHPRLLVLIHPIWWYERHPNESY